MGAWVHDRRQAAALGGKRRHGRGTVGARLGQGRGNLGVTLGYVTWRGTSFATFFDTVRLLTWLGTSFATFLTLTFVSDVAGTSFATISTRTPSSRGWYVFRHNLTWNGTSFVILSPLFHHSYTTPPPLKSIYNRTSGKRCTQGRITI